MDERRRRGVTRRSFGTTICGSAGTTLTFQPWLSAAETRQTCPVTLRATPRPRGPRDGVSAAVDAHEHPMPQRPRARAAR